MALCGPEIDLARPGDLLLLVLDHLVPLREPAGHARNREENREHLDGELHGLVDEARIEVHVGVQLAFQEVLVLERDPLELERDVEERVLARDLEDLLGHVLDDLRARVVVLVDAVAEAHEARLAAALLDRLDERRDVRLRANLEQHAEDGLVRAAVERAVEGRDRAGGRAVRVDFRGSDRTHRVRRAVLLVVGVQDEQHLERPLEHRVRHVFHFGRAVHHLQEVAAVREVVVRVGVRETDRVAVRERRESGHLRDEAHDLLPAGLGLMDVLGLRVERGKRGHRGREHSHRVRVVPEALHEVLDVFVDHRVERDVLHPVVMLVPGRELSVEHEIGRLEIGRLLGELGDRVTAVVQDALVPIDERDLALAGRRVHERGVVGHQPEVLGRGLQDPEIERLDRAVLDRNLDCLSRAVVGDGHGLPRCAG